MKSCDLKLVEVIAFPNFETIAESLLLLSLLFSPCSVFKELENSNSMIAISIPPLFIIIKNFKLPMSLHQLQMAWLITFKIYLFCFMICLQINMNFNSFNFKFPFLNLLNCFSMSYLEINDCLYHFFFMHFVVSQEFK